MNFGPKREIKVKEVFYHGEWISDAKFRKIMLEQQTELDLSY